MNILVYGFTIQGIRWKVPVADVASAELGPIGELRLKPFDDGTCKMLEGIASDLVTFKEWAYFVHVADATEEQE